MVALLTRHVRTSGKKRREKKQYIGFNFVTRCIGIIREKRKGMRLRDTAVGITECI